MDPFIGQIIMFGGNFAPRGWALCDGQLLSISQNTALFSILGTTYGGDGRTTFGLPDLRGRSPVHEGSGPGLAPASLGQKGGSENQTLTQAQMPNHTHTVRMPSDSEEGNSDDPDNKFPAVKDSDQYSNMSNSFMGPLTCSSVGGNQAFSVRSPYQVVNFIIALVGTFPSRN